MNFWTLICSSYIITVRTWNSFTSQKNGIRGTPGPHPCFQTLLAWSLSCFPLASPRYTVRTPHASGSDPSDPGGDGVLNDSWQRYRRDSMPAETYKSLQSAPLIVPRAITDTTGEGCRDTLNHPINQTCCMSQSVRTPPP